MSDPTDPQPLEDLNLRIIRAKNDEVDDRLSELETEVKSLQAEIDEKDETIDGLEEEKEQAKKLLAKLHEGQKQELLSRIEAANEAVDEENEVDLDAFEKADVEVLEAVADQVENLAEKATESTVSNRGSKPDLANVDPADVVDDDDVDLKEFAHENGLGSMYDRVIEQGDVRGPMKAGTGDSGAPSATDFMNELQRIGGDD